MGHPKIVKKLRPGKACFGLPPGRGTRGIKRLEFRPNAGTCPICKALAREDTIDDRPIKVRDTPPNCRCRNDAQIILPNGTLLWPMIRFWLFRQDGPKDMVCLKT